MTDRLRAVLHIATLEVRRRFRDRSLIVQGIVGPVVLAAIIGLAFGPDRFDLAVELGIADDDGTALTELFVDGLREAVEQPDGPPVTVVAQPSGAAAAQAVSDDAIDTALVIPEGFAAGLVDRSVEPVLLVYETGRRSLAGDVAVAVIERLAATIDTQRLVVAGGADLGLPTPSGSFVESPPGFVEEPVGGEFAAITYFAPSMAILFLFFTVGAGARSILRERADGTLSRVRAAPVGDAAVLAGKTLAVLCAGCVSLATVWAVTSLAFGADWGEPVGVALVLGATVVAVAGIAAVLAGVASTEAQADATTSATAFVLALVGGNFLPPGSMPPVFDFLSRFTPNGWALRALTDLSAGGAGVGAVVGPVAILLAMGLATGAVGIGLLSRRLT